MLLQKRSQRHLFTCALWKTSAVSTILQTFILNYTLSRNWTPNWALLCFYQLLDNWSLFFNNMRSNNQRLIQSNLVLKWIRKYWINHKSTIKRRNSAHFGNPEMVRYCGVLRYFASHSFVKFNVSYWKICANDKMRM